MAKLGYQENPLRNRLSKEQFLNLHHVQGITQTEMAKMFDVSMAYIIRLRKQYGIKVNKGIVRKPHVEVRPRVSLEDQTSPEEIKRLYHDEKLSAIDIGDKYGISRKTVWQYMIRHGIETRDKTQARRLALKAGRISQLHYDIDENFFAIWTAQMAWVLGLMFTDGNMCAGPSGVLTASLASIDLSLLEKVRSAMHSTHPIKKNHQSLGGSIYSFLFCRRKINEALVNFGVTPKKSLTIKFPYVPRPYLSHFIRGIFDGDGSVFFEARSRKSPLRVFFVSGSREFIEALEQNLNKNAGLSNQTIYSRPQGTSFNFKYAHTDCISFFKYIYAGADESMRMESKYQKFIEGFRNSGMSEESLAMTELEVKSVMLPEPMRVDVNLVPT